MRWKLAFGLIVLLGLAVAGGMAAWLHNQITGPGPLAEEETLVIPRGHGTQAIARDLADEGIIHHDWVFVLASRLDGDGRALRAGEYRFEPGMSVEDVLDHIRSGQTIIHAFTVPEGVTSQQVVDRLMADDRLAGELETAPDDGSILPDTYHFDRGDARQSLLDRMSRDMATFVDSAWEGRHPDLPFETPEEAIILASIVEKETGVAAERAKVAGVFVNRLRRGMRLQSDPTVVYALTNGSGPLDRTLTRADWEVDSIYNTYQIDGLPPGAIANPGRDAIEAVLNPEEHDYVYFVADGTGGHAFARTLAEHNRNVARWRDIRDNHGGVAVD